MTRNDICIV